MDKEQNLNQNLNQLDKQLFELYKNKKVPPSTHNAIKQAFNKESKKDIRKYIYRFAIYFISILIITTGVVFAKDIYNFISSFFTNSTDGIDEAINHGYVQNIDMDFVYDKDIGIKVDYLVMDEKNLDISYVYENNKEGKISSISINNYNIRYNNNNILYYENDTNNFNTIVKNYTRTNGLKKYNDNIFCESILYSVDELPNISNLIIEINSVTLNEKDVIEGTWMFNINIEKENIEKDIDTYIVSYNEYIKNITTYLNETTFKIEILLNTDFDEDILFNPDNTILSNKDKKEFIRNSMNFININENGEIFKQIILEYDVSKFSDNIDELKLNLRITKDKVIDLIMKKT